MSDVLSVAEVRGQAVELLPARTVLTTFGTGKDLDCCEITITNSLSQGQASENTNTATSENTNVNVNTNEPTVEATGLEVVIDILDGATGGG